MPLEALLENGSYLLILLSLLFAGVGVPVPEDVVLMSAGALLAADVTSLVPTVAICALGVLVGDLCTFALGRHLGTRAYEHRWVRRALPSRMRGRIEHWFRRHGGLTVLVARHVPGVRVPVFAMAGIQAMPLRRFLFWDTLGLCISLPLLLSIGYVFSKNLDVIAAHLARAEHYVVVGLVGLAALTATVLVLRRFFAG